MQSNISRITNVLRQDLVLEHYKCIPKDEPTKAILLKSGSKHLASC